MRYHLFDGVRNTEGGLYLIDGTRNYKVITNSQLLLEEIDNFKSDKGQVQYFITKGKSYKIDNI